LYEALENKPEESVVFILNIGKGAWGNTPPPDSTEPIAIDGMSGKLYYSNSQSTSGNPEYVATWQDQGQHYEIKAPSARITREEMMQILDSLVPLGKTPEPTPASPVPSATGTASTPSGRIAFVSDRDGYTAMAIFTIRPDGSGLTQITKGLGVIFYLAWSPDGKWLAFDVCPAPNGECADGNSDIYRVDTDGSNLRNLTHHPAFDSHPAWSPDGRFLVFDSNRSGQTALYRMAADGSDLRLVASGEMDIKEPTWSGNGSQIAANCTRWSTTDITTNTCLWPAEGGGPAVEFAGVGPVWSPVGLPGSMRVAVGRDRDHVTDIFSVRPDGGDAVNLTANPSNNFGPVWSPDGQWILFISNRSGSIDLYKVCAACPQGTPTLRLTADGLNHNFPVWSPDGGWIADLTGQTDETRLEIRRADGSGSRILTDQVKWSLAWQPKAP
jgi:TolB protein